MDAASLHSLEIDVVEILKVHDAQKQGFSMELFYDIFCAFDECMDEQFFYICAYFSCHKAQDHNQKINQHTSGSYYGSANSRTAHPTSPLAG